MLRYFLRKLFVYSVTFVMAVTVDWAIPHLMPGNPVLTLMGRIQVQDPKVAQQLYDHYMRRSTSTSRSGSSTATSGSRSSTATSARASSSSPRR